MRDSLSNSLTTDPSSPRFQEETRRYLQRRLRLLAGAVATLTSVLLVAFVVMMAVKRVQAGTPVSPLLREFTVEFPNAVLLWLVVLTGAMYLALSRRDWTPRLLEAIDALLFATMLAPCLMLYAGLHFYAFSGFAAAIPFMVLFILARAVLVPSGPWRTLLLSVPAPLGVAAIQLWYGSSFAFRDQAYPPAHFTDQLVQNQVILLGAIGVAALASRINLTLRQSGYDAKRLGQYDIHEMIGHGGMGEVYRATHSLLKRETAVKLLRAEVQAKDRLQRFEREVRQTSRLTHPNTVAIFDFGHTATGVFYYAMELLDGADLRKIVDHDGPMSAARVIHVLEQACGALGEAHSKGMVHRDVKPANIMLCERGGQRDVAKLLDFGLVRDYTAALGRRGKVEDRVLAGTPETMPPEVLHPEAIGPRSDIYSLGCVAYYLLTGEPVFKSNDTRELLKMHRSIIPEPVSKKVPGIPRDLELIVQRCLAKSLDQRPNDARTLRRELLACADAGKWTEDDATQWWRANEEALEAKRFDPSEKGDLSRMSTILMPQDSRLMDLEQAKNDSRSLD